MTKWHDGSDGGDDDGGNLVVDRPPTEDRERQDLVPPSPYAVLLLNDDFTPMDFVVGLIVNLFGKGMDEAEAIMMEIHTKGKGLVGTFPKDIAETKVAQVIAVAQEAGHPFRAETEALH